MQTRPGSTKRHRCTTP